MRVLNSTAARYPAELNWITYGIFFLLGAITSLNDVIVPKLKGLFALPYAKIMLVPAAFFGAYLCMALPASWLIRRIGFLRTGAFGLTLMCAGCLLFVPAAAAATFPVFLGAIFVLASGITFLQVMVNPLTAMLGSPATANSRLSFAQAFYSLGTTIAPWLGATVILGAVAAGTAPNATVIGGVYLVLAVVIAIVAVLVWWRRRSLVEVRAATPPLSPGFRVLQRPRFALGCLSAFVYVGAEIAIGSIIVNYLMQSSVMGLTAQSAGRHLPFYWGGSMIGRFLGGSLLRHVAQGRVLIGATGVALTLLLVSANIPGEAAGWALLAIGLCNSVMYPTIFALASGGLGEHVAEGSGVIVLASVGGAIVPVLTGVTADHLGLKVALGVPALCYAIIMGYGLFVQRRHSV